MNKVWTLTALELKSAYGINRFRYTRDPKAKKRYRLMTCVWAYLLLLVVAYVVGLVYGLWSLGLGDIVPAYLAVLASLLVLFFGMFGAGAAVFRKQGYGILISLPIRVEQLALSRIVALYAEDLLLTALLWLPGMAVFAALTKPGILFYPAALLAGLLLPAIPLVLSVLLGTAIHALSSGSRHKSLVQSVLMVLLVVGVLAGSLFFGGAAEELTPEHLAQLAQNLGVLLGKLYPPAAWLGSTLSSGSPWGLCLFMTASLAVLVLTVWLVSWVYEVVMTRLLAVNARHSYQMQKLSSQGLLKALYIREVKRYFASSIYVTNTIIGPIMGAIASVGLWYVGPKAIPFDIGPFLPLAISAVFTMMTTTAVALSMEGKHFWVVKSLPIPVKTLLDAKYLLNLSLMAPFYVISEAFLLLAVKPAPLQALWMLWIPAALSVLMVVFGITVNGKLRSFDWTKEEQVVKQSASAVLGGFGGLLVCLALGAVLFLVPESFRDLYYGAISILLPLLTWLLYWKNQKIKLEEL